MGRAVKVRQPLVTKLETSQHTCLRLQDERFEVGIVISHLSGRTHKSCWPKLTFVGGIEGKVGRIGRAGDIPPASGRRLSKIIDDRGKMGRNGTVTSKTGFLKKVKSSNSGATSRIW